MIKSSPLQIFLVILGILSVFQGIQVLVSNAMLIRIEEFLGGYSPLGLIILNFFGVGLFHGLLGFLLVKKSKSWSQALQRGISPDPAWQIMGTNRLVLFYIFVALGAYGCIREFPYLLVRILVDFADRAGREYPPIRSHEPVPESWLQLVMKSFLPLLVLLLAKNLAEYFSAMTGPGESGDPEEEIRGEANPS
jgi:hypothetical protein